MQAHAHVGGTRTSRMHSVPTEHRRKRQMTDRRKAGTPVMTKVMPCRQFSFPRFSAILSSRRCLFGTSAFSCLHGCVCEYERPGAYTHAHTCTRVRTRCVQACAQRTCIPLRAHAHTWFQGLNFFLGASSALGASASSCEAAAMLSCQCLLQALPLPSHLLCPLSPLPVATCPSRLRCPHALLSLCHYCFPAYTSTLLVSLELSLSPLLTEHTAHTREGQVQVFWLDLAESFFVGGVAVGGLLNFCGVSVSASASPCTRVCKGGMAHREPGHQR